MSKLTIQSYVMPAAAFPRDNPLTPLRSYDTASAAGASAPQADYPDRGREHSILPYRLQDQYDRRRAPRAFKTAVLENQHLRATFLLEVGGRLWSLVDKRTRRELLYVNPVFQPANLAVRDAWFTGGVEWNISIIGHCPLTCDPLFAVSVPLDERDVEHGGRALRLYEWDRIRRVPFQIDFWLSDDVPFLFARPRIVNPNDHTIPMYWWSNIAVPEREDVRVLGPATQAYRHDYDGSLVAHDIPFYDGADVTYTTNRKSAADLYFRIPEGHRPWIAALDGDGRGLIHASTARLRGRKMFNWGMDPGGRRWQEFLSQPGEAYLEIQGGLAQTQGDYVAMPAGAEWSWLEAYGLIEADPATVHGNDWRAAYEAVEAELDRRLPQARLDADLARTARLAQLSGIHKLHHGSGWGALEARRRRHAGEPPFTHHSLTFRDNTITDDQKPWLALLETGELAYRSPADGPGALMVQPEWRALLERAAHDGRSTHWLAWYHLGVMRYRAGDSSGAREAWQQSLAAESSAWVLRDLAFLSMEQGEDQTAIDLWLRAARTAPQCVPLAIEVTRMLLTTRRFAELMKFVDALPDPVRAAGRIRLLRAMAALEQGDLATVEKYFEGDVDIPNIREKETTLSDLWFRWQEQRVARERGVEIDDTLRQQVRREFPPPVRFDFRLNTQV
jgi:hypothetical protein